MFSHVKHILFEMTRNLFWPALNGIDRSVIKTQIEGVKHTCNGGVIRDRNMKGAGTVKR